jgi:DNA-3-methyladenine glycosylase
MPILKQDFFARPTLVVARDLLGQRLVREVGGQRLSGRIVETEAYIGPDDTACHASRGRTPRTEIMFGQAGYTYVYLIYGMYYMLNFITEQEGFPAAVLIRAIEPLAGVNMMRVRRQKANRLPLNVVRLTNGPGKLCQALGIDKKLHNWDVTTKQRLWLEAGDDLPQTVIATGFRVGINYAAPQDRVAPWRFWIQGNRFVSKE